MQKIIVILSIIYTLTVTGCAQVKVISVEKLNLNEKEGFFHPKLDNSGENLILTSENYKGLYLYDLKTNTLKMISDENGAGYSATFSADDKTILFTSTEFINNRLHTKVLKWEKSSDKKEVVISPVRELLFLNSAGGKHIYKTEGGLKSLQIGNETNGPDLAVGIEDRKLTLYSNDTKRTIDPLKSESYIWPSLSADGKKILAYSMNKGAFICDTDGKLIKELGNLEAPVWAGDNSVAGMVTKDDGKHITEAEVVVTDIKTGNRTLLSPKGIIAMYPSVSASKDKLVFQTSEGEIYLVKYRINP